MNKVSIVGGGLVGSMLAIRLKQLDYEVEIFEKREDPRKNLNDFGRSINLIITSRGFNTLKAAGLYQKALELCKAVYGRQMHDKNGQEIYQAYGRDSSEANYSISRSELNKFLLTECENLGIPIHFAHSLESVDPLKKTLHFSVLGKSQIKTYDKVIGTDGAGSVFRKSLKNILGSSYTEGTEFIHSDYKELFMSLAENGSPQLKIDALHIWPRGTHMLMALPNLDGSFTMTCYLPRDGQYGDRFHFQNLTDQESVLEFLKNEFPDALSKIPNAAQQFLENPQGKLGTVRSAPWYFQDSLLLLGDAAHAIVPFFGQGMNLGFEDISNFTSELIHCDHNWSLALPKFNGLQITNANAIADMALENFNEMREKVGDQQFLFKKKVEAKIESCFPEIYRSRYGMITYTLIPYGLCQKAGLIQEQILSELTKDLHELEQLDLAKAQSLLEKYFVPFLTEHKINIKNWNS